MSWIPGLTKTYVHLNKSVGAGWPSTRKKSLNQSRYSIHSSTQASIHLAVSRFGHLQHWRPDVARHFTLSRPDGEPPAKRNTRVRALWRVTPLSARLDRRQQLVHFQTRWIVHLPQAESNFVFVFRFVPDQTAKQWSDRKSGNSRSGAAARTHTAGRRNSATARWESLYSKSPR
jgi:hypothetical protein